MRLWSWRDDVTAEALLLELGTTPLVDSTIDIFDRGRRRRRRNDETDLPATRFACAST